MWIVILVVGLLYGRYRRHGQRIYAGRWYADAAREPKAPVSPRRRCVADQHVQATCGDRA